MNSVKKYLDGVDRGLTGVIALLMATLVIVITADVVGRYIFGKSLIFASELSRMCFIWITFLVMPLGISRGLHVAITTLPDALGPKARGMVYRLGVVIVFVLMCVVLAGAVVSIRARSFEPLNTLPVSAAWYYYPLAIGAVWSLVHLIVRFVDGKPVERNENPTEHALS
jgi:TRAP-type C4-dicarboxylate transport system permease small subunit